MAEMTGRSNRIVRGRADGRLRLEPRHSDSKLDNLNVAECKVGHSLTGSHWEGLPSV